jgi:hypothetical protein
VLWFSAAGAEFVIFNNKKKNYTYPKNMKKAPYQHAVYEAREITNHYYADYVRQGTNVPSRYLTVHRQVWSSFVTCWAVVFYGAGQRELKLLRVSLERLCCRLRW